MRKKNSVLFWYYSSLQCMEFYKRLIYSFIYINSFQTRFYYTKQHCAAMEKVQCATNIITNSTAWCSLYVCPFLFPMINNTGHNCNKLDFSSFEPHFYRKQCNQFSMFVYIYTSSHLYLSLSLYLKLIASGVVKLMSFRFIFQNQFPLPHTCFNWNISYQLYTCMLDVL